MKKIKKPKSTKREKIFFLITLISVIVAVGAIVHAQTGQSHPAIEITYSNIPCSNICNDDDTDGDTSSSNELQTLSSVLNKGNTASKDIDMNRYSISNQDWLNFDDNDGDGTHWSLSERASTLYGFPKGSLVLEYSWGNGCYIDDTNRAMHCTGGFDAKGAGITNPGKLLQNMDCKFVNSNNGGSSKSHTALCPDGYYVMWAGCNAEKSIDKSTCHAADGTTGLCDGWYCYTGETNNLISIQMQCCR